MDMDRFDTLTSRVSARRGILAAALGAIPGLGFLTATGTNARKRHKRNCRRIMYRIAADTCPTIKTNTCGAKKSINCQSGKICLDNKSCGLACAATNCPAETGCTCSTSEPRACLAPFTTCTDVPTPCATTADCPMYTTCDAAPCGEGGATEKRCLRLCGHAVVPQPAVSQAARPTR